MKKIEEIKFLMDAYYKKFEENEKDEGKVFLEKLKTLLLTDEISSEAFEIFRMIISKKVVMRKPSSDIGDYVDIEVPECYTYKEAMLKCGFKECNDGCSGSQTYYQNTFVKTVNSSFLTESGWKNKAGSWFPPKKILIVEKVVEKNTAKAKPVPTTDSCASGNGGRC